MNKDEEKGQRINIVLFGRKYPLTVYSQEEEQICRESAKKLSEKTAEYQRHFENKELDFQDFLALAAFDLAIQLTENKLEEQVQNDEMTQQIKGLLAKVKNL